MSVVYALALIAVPLALLGRSSGHRDRFADLATALAAITVVCALADLAVQALLS